MNCAWEIRTCKYFLIRRIIRTKSIKEIELPLHPSRCIWIKFVRRSLITNLDIRIIKIQEITKNDEEAPRNIDRSLLMIPYCNSNPISISRWCSIEGTLEGIDTAKYALKLAPLEARSTLLPYDHPVRHSPHPGSREYRKGSNCCAIRLGIVAYIPLWTDCAIFIRRYENYMKN